MNDYLGNLTTESVNEKTKHIDECSTTEILMLINEEDSLVAGAERRRSLRLQQRLILL